MCLFVTRPACCVSREAFANRVHKLTDATEDDVVAQITRRLRNHDALDAPASTRRFERLLARSTCCGELPIVVRGKVSPKNPTRRRNGLYRAAFERRSGSEMNTEHGGRVVRKQMRRTIAIRPWIGYPIHSWDNPTGNLGQ